MSRSRSRSRSILIILAAVFIIAAGLLSYAGYKHSKTEDLKDQVRRSGKNPRVIAPVGALFRELGPTRGVEFVEAIDDEYDAFIFDGETRFAQVHKDGFGRLEDPRGNSDALVLTRLTDAENSSSSAMWWGPPGMTIDGAHFTDEGLSVHAAMDSHTGQALEFELFVPWHPGEEPQPGRFDDQVPEDILHSTNGQE